MVHFVRKRLQVFVSSTYSDLRDERQAAVEAILVAGHIPAGMELFTAGDESQMDAIKQWIDESDVYLLILGGRYGSIEPSTRKSYTRLEYEYAVSLGKPMFSCVITEAALEEKIRKLGSSAMETTEPAGLRDFRSVVLTKLVRFWTDPKDIKITVGETLAQFARREDLVGWVRPPENDFDVTTLAEEIARLSKENAQLREQASLAQGPRILGFSFEELVELLSKKSLLSFLLKNKSRLESTEGLEIDPTKRLKELRFIGLVESRLPDFGGYRLTEQGRLFLNRLEFIRLKSEERKSVGAA